MAGRLTPAAEIPTALEAAAHPVTWAMYASEGAWQPARHLWWIADRTMELLDGDTRFLAISCPPGHGKSEYLSKYLPTFFLGRNPRGRVIQCSYGESLTLEWSRVSRDLLAQHGHDVFGVDVPPRASAKSWDVFRFDPSAGRTKREGYLRAVGRGGSITGKRAELLICDDLIKDDMEAQSATMRDQAWRWFNMVALSRLTATGKAIVVMTRWHHDDIIGRLEQRQASGQDSDGWKIVRLPAIAEESDPLGRAPGEALWPEMFPLAELERIRARDAATWSALYQGRPTPSQGVLFQREWFRYAVVAGDRVTFPDSGRVVPLENCYRFATMDLAFSTKTSADYAVIAAWAVVKGGGQPALVLLDLHRDRIGAPDLVRAMSAMVSKLNLGTIHLESDNFHLKIVQQALRAGLPVRELKPDKDKEARAQPAAAAFAAGHVWLARGSSWIPEYETELLQFPAAAHDDQVDATAYGVQVFQKFVRFGGDDGDRKPRYEPKQQPRCPQGPRWRFGR